MNNKIGKLIKAIRKSKSMTQQDLSQLTGISRVHISNIESGNVNLPPSSLNKIAASLDVPSVLFIHLSDDTIEKREINPQKDNLNILVLKQQNLLIDMYLNLIEINNNKRIKNAENVLKRTQEIKRETKEIFDSFSIPNSLSLN